MVTKLNYTFIYIWKYIIMTEKKYHKLKFTTNSDIRNILIEYI